MFTKLANKAGKIVGIDEHFRFDFSLADFFAEHFRLSFSLNLIGEILTRNLGAIF